VCRGSSDFIFAFAKLDIFLVFVTPTFCCQSLRTAPSWTFILAASNAVTYEVFEVCRGCLVRCLLSRGEFVLVVDAGGSGGLAGGDGVVAVGGDLGHWRRQCTHWWTIMFRRWYFLPLFGHSLCFSPVFSGRSPRGGGFALPEVTLVPEVVVTALLSELDHLEVGGVLPRVEAALLALLSLRSAARPPHTLVRDAAARMLSSASWALATGGPSRPHLG